MASVVQSSLSIIDALRRLEHLPGVGQLDWQATNPAQDELVGYFPLLRGAPVVPGLNGIAHFDIAVVNQFLVDSGFGNIQLNPNGPGDIAAASVLDVKAIWKQAGRAINMYAPSGSTFDGVHLPGDHIDFYEASGHPNPIAEIETQGAYSVWMTRMDRVPEGRFGLLRLAAELSATAKGSRMPYEALQFPMVSINDLEGDLSWLIGLNAVDQQGQLVQVSQALSAAKLWLNEQGARAQVATAVAATRGMPLEMVINGPFAIWFQLPGLSVPVVAFHVDVDHFKNPDRDIFA